MCERGMGGFRKKVIAASRDSRCDPAQNKTIHAFPLTIEGTPMLDRDGGLLRGTLDLLVLKSLAWGPRHGYATGSYAFVNKCYRIGPTLRRAISFWQ
jgi:hypothetical protein